MSDPTDPPRPSLRQSVRDFLAGCVWNQQQSRVETSTGDPVVAWLNQTGSPGITATVQWEASKQSDLADAVGATIPYDTWNIVKNGSFDSSTGLVTYQGTGYRFRFEIVSGTATMKQYA